MDEEKRFYTLFSMLDRDNRPERESALQLLSDFMRARKLTFRGLVDTLRNSTADDQQQQTEKRLNEFAAANVEMSRQNKFLLRENKRLVKKIGIREELALSKKMRREKISQDAYRLRPLLEVGKTTFKYSVFGGLAVVACTAIDTFLSFAVREANITDFEYSAPWKNRSYTDKIFERHTLIWGINLTTEVALSDYIGTSDEDNGKIKYYCRDVYEVSPDRAADGTYMSFSRDRLTGAKKEKVNVGNDQYQKYDVQEIRPYFVRQICKQDNFGD